MLEAIFARNPAEKLYVEDVFSAYTYTGTGASQTITNDINLSGKGGMVWMKCRSGVNPNAIFDTNRGGNNLLFTDTSAQIDVTGEGVTSFNTNGFTIGNNVNWNQSASTFGSWTFRKAPKFFDIVTYTGNETDRAISHGLGSVPGMIIIKATSSTGNWTVKHRSLATSGFLRLNTTAAVNSSSFIFPSNPTSSEFYIGTSGEVNSTGVTYVAYLFAHDTAADGLVQCGSFTAASGNFSVNLGWEPQFLLLKRTTGSVEGWHLFDNMRGLTVNGINDALLQPNSSNAESAVSWLDIQATGFSSGTSAAFANDWIYMAIRRGPMRKPTDATKVFSPILQNASQGTKATTGFAVDMQIETYKTGGRHFINDRLRGVSSTSTGAVVALDTTDTGAESTDSGLSAGTRGWDNTGFQQPFYYDASNAIFWNFARAPGFLDVFSHTGDGTIGRQINHNLGVSPELVISKARSTASDWRIVASAIGFNTGDAVGFNSNAAKGVITRPISAASATTVTLDTSGANASGVTYITYLFASCPGVSKVGSYTGNGSSINIDCGFTNGARFVLIKRTDSTGDWYVWDTARGIVAANDPHLSLNSIAAEVTTNDSIDPLSTGFTVNQVAATNINVINATYIYLAIA